MPAGTRIVMMLAYVAGWASAGCDASACCAVTNPQNAYDWAAAMVQRYKPKGVLYYQIANEPTSEASFWCESGSNPPTSDPGLINTYLGPIFQAVKDNGGFVVAPAWASIDGIPQLVDLLNATSTYNNKALIQNVDYIDIHYHSLGDWMALWTAFSGRIKGLYQSEFGNEDVTGALARNMSGYLYWALDPAGGGWHGSNDPYKFAMAWYSECCAADGSGNFALDLCKDAACSTLEENGVEAQTLTSVFGRTDPLSVYTNFTGGPSNPGYPSLPTNMGFYVGNGGKVAILMFGSGSQTIQASGFSAKPASCTGIDMQGNAVAATCSYSAGTETVSTTIPNGATYVIITP